MYTLYTHTDLRMFLVDAHIRISNANYLCHVIYKIKRNIDFSNKD